MTPFEQSIEAPIKADVAATKSWFLAHERLIVTILILAVAVFFGNSVLSHQVEKDKAAENVAQQALSIQQEQNKTLAAQVAQSQSQYTVLAAQMASQNAQLAQAVQTRTVVLRTQQTADRALPMPDLGNRWATLAKIQPSEMTATAQGVSVTPDAARITVAQLEEVPVLQQNLVDSQKQTANLATELAASNNLTVQLSDQVTGLKTELIDTKITDAAELKTAKAESRKGKLKFFGIGYAAGFVSGLVVHIF